MHSNKTSARTADPRPARNTPPPEAVSTPAQTREDLLKWTGRGYTVVRHILVQLPKSEAERPSVLGPMVTDRKRRSLQLLLLLLTLEPFRQTREMKDDPPLTAAVYARALSTKSGRQWTPSLVSATLGDLERRGLVERRRLPHGLVVLPRREDGKDDYTKPGLVKKDRWHTYFVLPPEFWLEEWFERLSLPGLAMLLIIASETSNQPEVWLTNKDAARWYGMAERTIQAGITDLKEHNLVDVDVRWTRSSASRIGATAHHYYSLTGPFSYEERAMLQKQAQSDLRKRTLASDPGSAPKKKRKKKPREKLSGTAESTPPTQTDPNNGSR